MKKIIKLFHLSFIDFNISGGDKIFIEYLKYIDTKKFEVIIYTNEFGINIYNKYIPLKQVSNFRFILIKNKKVLSIGHILSHPLRIIYNSIQIIKLSNSDTDFIISTSDFLTDVIPSIIEKIKSNNSPKIFFSFFLKAPNPFMKNFPYKGLSFISGFFYWFIQLISIFLINKYNDGIIICSKIALNFFKNDNYLYIPGGVDQKPIKNLTRIKTIDACYYARFHPQKGPDEAIYIWKQYVDNFNKNAVMCMIGDGPLFIHCKKLVINLNLQKNITFEGYIHDALKKEKIFLKSKLILHTAIYDTGGMAALEGMSYGIPAISYDLEGLRETYPKGMYKIKPYDRNQFSKKIDDLIGKDSADYNKIRKEALNLIKEWNWIKRYNEFDEYISRQ